MEDKAYWYQDDTARKFGGISPQVTPDLWNEISKINHEIENYKKVFLSKTASDEYHIFLRRDSVISDHPLHTILKDLGEGVNVRYLLVVNVDGAPLEGKFSFPWLLSKVTSLFDNQPITSSTNAFFDNFPAYGAKLYKLESNIQIPIIGDLNHDNKVDIFDYNLLVGNFGNTTCGNAADIDGTCKVDIFDYNILVGNFGLPASR